MHNLFSLDSYRYDLPSELIAKRPCEPRDHSRLMLVNKSTGDISEIPFYEITNFLQAGDQLILNNTKVIPARLFGRKSSGAKVEIFLLRQRAPDVWQALAKPGKKLPAGSKVIFGDDFSGEIMATEPDGTKEIRFSYSGSFNGLLSKYGHIPIPHYMQREDGKKDLEDYQTIYASEPGAVAAPTAGLHFTSQLLDQLKAKEVLTPTITLHVGLGTFQPVQVADIRDHRMHTETFQITPQAEAELQASTGKQICVGTTTCRALESVVEQEGMIKSGHYDTNIFIYPGYKFRYVKTLLTNFHLPESSLLMLVCAFGGYPLMMEAYRKAIKERYRFYSYGDAMLIY